MLRRRLERILATRRVCLSRTSPAFTLIEMTVVLVIVGLMLAIASGAFAMFRERTSARRAAQIFSYDLLMARGMALRSQEQVTVKFRESARWYDIKTASGRELVRRQFTRDGDVSLSALDLTLTGDSLTFSNRGVANLGGATVGVATFRGGTTTYRVRFNSMASAVVAKL